MFQAWVGVFVFWKEYQIQTDISQEFSQAGLDTSHNYLGAHRKVGDCVTFSREVRCPFLWR